MNKYIRIIMVCVVTVVFLIKVVPLMRKNVRCDALDQFLAMSFKGIVNQKYIDSSQHSYKTVVLYNFEDSVSKKIFFDFDLNDSFDKINVRDTIYKDIHNDSIFKLINRQKIFISKIDYGCER